MFSNEDAWNSFPVLLVNLCWVSVDGIDGIAKFCAES